MISQKKLILILLGLILILANCTQKKDAINTTETPFVWEAANVYFLLTDRFHNGDTSNDLNFDRIEDTGVLRNFMGGDLRGIIQKIEEGYFTDLGINAIWMTPIVEQIHGAVDEGTGKTYAFHGYWTKDWTALDPNFGTKEELAELVTKAHAKGIRIVLDAVINHTGPVTAMDPVFPQDWVRTAPKCTYDSYENYIHCTLVENLPDVLTENEADVDLPPQLVEKWKNEGRYDAEIASLDTFFEKTGYPRAPKYYIMKWLSDYITEFGIDGYRVDTVKHTTEDVWTDFAAVCQDAFKTYKTNNPSKVLDNNDFFLIGEVYGYGIHGGRLYDFGDKKVDYFAHGFDNLINFDFKGDAHTGYADLFEKYNTAIHTVLKGKSIMNYGSSHDDGHPFDKERTKTYEMGTKLLLTPGISQIYYGDEVGRSLIIEGTVGDATLRSMMPWETIATDPEKQALLKHYQKLGQFRANHPSVGAGIHQKIAADFFVCSRTFEKENFKDAVVIALDTNLGKKSIPVGAIFEEGTAVRDAYSNQTGIVKNGSVLLDTAFTIVLLERL